MAGLKIPKHKMMSMRELNIYTSPKIVYIPLIIGNDTDLDVKVNIGDSVLKGEVLASKKGNVSAYIYSSVSGRIKSFSDVTYFNGNKVSSLVIENNFVEKPYKRIERKDIDKISKEEFIKIIESLGIVGMGGAGFPTYLKYQTDNKINTLLINAVECEPYVTADYTILMNHCEEILETIDNILTINNIKEAIIAIKETNVELLKHINKYMGTYLRIRIVEVPNLYPIGWERTLIKQTLKLEYNNLPIEKGIIVNNVSTIYAISKALRYNEPITERIVTFTGEGLKNPQNVLLKVGTKIDEVIDYLGGMNKNTIIIANGPMMGSKADNDLVVTPTLNCILVLNKISKEYTHECLRCGRCVKYCPAKLSPVLIKDSLNDLDRLKELQALKCVECGLCSYVCPSKIDVRNYVKKSKEKIKGGK